MLWITSPLTFLSRTQNMSKLSLKKSVNVGSDYTIFLWFGQIVAEISKTSNYGVVNLLKHWFGNLVAVIMFVAALRRLHKDIICDLENAFRCNFHCHCVFWRNAFSAIYLLFLSYQLSVVEWINHCMHWHLNLLWLHLGCIRFVPAVVT